ncbi:hypothetical protein [Prosthecobacter dejongeii]|uniref:Uncharacterized protein n=1 Tax=Prosthecobacter dejongeii TaxID=48465 RepID=A0A7W8DQ01_9BACT|nr:hypothetical protein [Prosthecobacter dejongeii]MBB5037700.1 hypothetical protein [Prosthecobacter dejongeii]
MPTTLNTANKPTFTQLVDTFKDSKNFVKGDKVSLRLSGENLHTKSSRLSRWGPTAKNERLQKRAKAVLLVTESLNEHLQKAGLGRDAGAKLMLKLQSRGEISSDRITVKDLKRLNTEVKTKIQEHITHSIQEFAEAGIDGFMDENVSWKVSDGGAGGVIIAEKNTGEKSILKIDNEAYKIADSAYSILNTFRTAVGENLPFDVPNMVLLDVPDNSNLYGECVSKIEQEVKSLQTDLDKAIKGENLGLAKKIEQKLVKLQGSSHRDGMKQNLVKHQKVMKFEMVENAQQGNLLSPEKKLELLRSNSFGQSVGQSMVLLQFMGFNDHLNMGNNMANGSNFSNIMINEEGRLNLIDPSMGQVQRKDKSIGYGIDTDSLKDKFSGATNFLKILTATSPEAFEEWMAGSLKMDSKLGFSTGDDNPISNVLFASFSPPFEGGTLFYRDTASNRDETEQWKSIPESSKRLFAINVIKGMAEGLQMLSRNSESLGEKLSDNGLTSHDPKDTLNHINQGLEGLDFNKLDEKLNRLTEIYQNQGN